jgi:hypothetical protein
LGVNASSGLISGSPTTAGTYNVTAQVSDGRGGTATRAFVWTINASGSGSLTVQYVKLESLSEKNGNPWSAIAEFNLLDGSGAVMSRTGWIVSADSSETQAVDNSPPMAIDGSAWTYWHSQWSTAIDPPQPHWFVVNLGSARTISGFKYLPPPANDSNGTIAAWRFHTSTDGVNWTQVAQGTFASDATEKTVNISAPAANQVPTLAAVANQTTTVGQSVSLALSASDPDGDTLSYSASGLPPGLGVNASSGLISGSPTTAGTYNVTAQVSDGRGGAASQAFVWTINIAPASVNEAPTLAAVANQTTVAGQRVSLTLSASDPDGDTLTYSASGLPPGLSINTTSGLIKGTPKKVGTYQVTAGVSDGRGGTATRSFVWTIIAK